MTAVAAALGTMAAIAVVGWLLGRAGALGPGAEQVLSRTVFTVCVPSLLMVTIAHADLGLLLSRVAVVTALSTAVVALIAAVVLRALWRRPAGEATVGVLAASYLNAGNLGIPIAVYLLGDAVAVVPTLLFQLLVLAPIAFTVLDSAAAAAREAAARGAVDAAGALPDSVADLEDPEADGARPTGTLAHGPGTVTRTVTRILRNPIIIGALAGVVLALLPWTLPEVAFEPFRLIGAAAAPLALIAFGLSLALPQTAGRHRVTRDLVLVIALRSVVHPLLAALLGRMLGLDGPALLAVVIMAALPTAQNVLVYALRYGRGEAVARDAGLVTTVLALPVMLAIAAVLG